MSKFIIKQSNSQTEEIKFGIIKNLYNFDKNINLSEKNIQGRLHSLGEYEYQINYLHEKYYPNLIIQADKYYFYFQDPEIERLCALNFSSDGNGCTLEDLSKVICDRQHDIVSVFKNNTKIEHFDELNSFTNVTYLPAECFRECTNLKTINLENIVDMHVTNGMSESFTFNNCSSLEKIYAPKLTYTGVYTFANCTSLKYIVMPLFNTIARYDGRWIQNCSSLEYILLGKIKEIRAGDNWHTGEFNGNKNLKVVDLGDNLNNISNLPFNDCTNMKAIIIRNTDAIPTISDHENSSLSFARRFGSNDVKFFVSDNLLNDYKNSSDWNEMIDKLYPLSEFNLSNYIEFEIPEVEDLYNNLNAGS